MKSPPPAIASLLFVCMGNICRSPAAENVMRKQLADAGLAKAVRCDSAGVIGYHAGEPPDARMRTAGRQRGLLMTGIARQVSRADLDTFDLILAMDDDNYDDLLKLSSTYNRDKIKRFCTYLTKHRVSKVPDPYYGGSAGFEHVLDLLEDGCTQIVAEISKANSQ